MALCIVWAPVHTVFAKPPAQNPLVSHFKTSSKPFSPKTKIFLVAGSSDYANFAQEIMDQRRLWKSIGFSEDEIACYYVIPKKGEYRRDHDQYLTLDLWLPDCYPANVKLIREHLGIIAKTNPPFLYLYLTSHGKKPVTLDLAKANPNGKRYQFLKEMSQYPVVDQYRLLIDALPDGPASQREIFAAYKKGKNPRDLYFTPAYLREMLMTFPVTVPKFIVLQGCYSGGFINDYQVSNEERLLTSVPQITILAAARHDRTSFGCAAGPYTTYYGGMFNQVLSYYLDYPTKMDWELIHHEVKEKVRELEEEKPDFDPSLPVFFSNFKKSK